MVTKDREARKRFRAEHPVSSLVIAVFYDVAKAIESRLCNETWKGGSFFGSTAAAAADWKDRERGLLAQIKTSGGGGLKTRVVILATRHGILWYADETKRGRTGQDEIEWRESKDVLGWKQGGRRMRRRGYNFVFHGYGTSRSRGVVARNFTKNSSRGTARSTSFRRTKRGKERFVPFRSIPSHVSNDM
ncbi:hypothetical protein DVH24_011413 [Malus domestica]|uniref:Uncharacterized protein n=1 Tax=Malus domestica TaxID=3750 RepID=A0A498JTB9_MALDO|nr:hypothetical protein DVH24_011413 [Malus domestica]